MSNLSLYLGGAKSGKSKTAVDYAKNNFKNVTFIATCLPNDDTMRQRIEKHKLERPDSWQTIENGSNLSETIPYINKNTGLIIVDSLGIYISNLILSDISEKDILSNITLAINSFQKLNIQVIFVSDETGLGVHPSSPLGNTFRDVLGNVNQLIAAEAAEVLFFVAGLHIKIK